jgi:hypothetical protein
LKINTTTTILTVTLDVLTQTRRRRWRMEEE